MIKYLVSDLDGTLFKGHKDSLFNLAKENEEMLKKINENNDITFCIASGRNIYYGLYVVDKYEIKNKLVSGYNGASFYDNGYLDELYLTYDLVSKIYDIASSIKGIYHFQILLSNGDRIFSEINEEVFNIYKDEMKLISHGNIPYITISDYLKNKDKHDIIKVTINFYDEIDTSLAFEKLSILSDLCTITSSGKVTLELSAKGRNKGSFIKYLMNKYKLNYDEIATIGDAMNDTEMFDLVKYSFCMSHASDDVKSHALYVVDSVYEAYKKIRELNKK